MVKGIAPFFSDTVSYITLQRHNMWIYSCSRMPDLFVLHNYLNSRCSKLDCQWLLYTILYLVSNLFNQIQIW